MAATVEGAILEALRGESAITDLVSTFAGYPAIFTDIAPQQAEKTYMVFDVQKTPSDNLAVDIFLIDIDVYYNGLSAVDARELLFQVEILLDRAVLECTNYMTVRFYRDSDGYVDNSDIKIGHYNQQFEARGTRKRWIDNI